MFGSSREGWGRGCKDVRQLKHGAEGGANKGAILQKRERDQSEGWNGCSSLNDP